MWEKASGTFQRRVPMLVWVGLLAVSPIDAARAGSYSAVANHIGSRCSAK